MAPISSYSRLIDEDGLVRETSVATKSVHRRLERDEENHV
jgi:hypothetical protein